MGAGQSTIPLPNDDAEGEEQFQDASSSSFAPKYSVSLAPSSSSTVRLYKHEGGAGAAGKYVLVAPSVPWLFAKLNDGGSGEGEDEDEEEEEEEEVGGKKPWLRKREEAAGRGGGGEASWHLLLVGRVTAKVDERMGVMFNDEQARIDFVAGDVWAIRFKKPTEYSEFGEMWKKCLFENTYGVDDTMANRTKIFGKEFVDWGEGEDGDESMWDAEENLEEGKEAKRERQKESNHLKNTDVQETFRSTPKGKGVQSITMGALQNSYLIHGSGIDVYRNRDRGLEGTDLSVMFGERGRGGGGGGGGWLTPKKGLLMREESTMMLMSPSREDMMHATGVRQVDLNTEKVVANWQFEKDGTPISMRDIVADSKSAQLEPNSSFLGLDDNRLCRWDMRDPHGIVQDLTSPSVLSWNMGHQFSRGTNFTCCATTGSGAIAVGSKDGKVRMYGNSVMNRAKSVFPGAGFGPVTHIDVTFDGKWIVATTDTCVVVLSTVYYDKNGGEKTGFEGRMGGKMGAPRLLKLNPIDAHRAGTNACFRKAQFSWVTDSDRPERNIVVSVGQFSVVWNFRRVKQTEHECYRSAVGGFKTCFCYRVVSGEEAIVESRFMHDNFMGFGSPVAPLIVATPDVVSSFNV